MTLQHPPSVFYGPAGLQVLLLLQLQLQLLLLPPPPPPSPPPSPSLLLPLPLLLPLLLLLLLPLSGPSRRHLMAHGPSLIGHTSANNVLTVRTYCHMAGGENITREPKPKSVSNHFALH